MIEIVYAQTPAVAVVTLARLMQQRPHRRLEVVGRDRRAARVVSVPPLLSARIRDGRADVDIVHKEGDLIEAVGLIDVGSDLRICDYIFESIDRTFAIRLAKENVISTPSPLAFKSVTQNSNRRIYIR